MTNRLGNNHAFKVCDKQFDLATMHCPICDFDYTHLESVEMDFESKDSRLCARLNFSCENEHNFTVRVQQHKGQTFFLIEKITPMGRSWGPI
tara:strand:+ start:120 stop:395 length:276 start_codon:yes stop_codon:yes gene_type:complete